jgi:predicted transcriptional regulator
MDKPVSEGYNQEMKNTNEPKQISVPSQKEFTDHIKDHLAVTGEKPSSFGRRVLGDSGAIPRLFEGTDPRLSTMHKILKAIGVKK